MTALIFVDTNILIYAFAETGDERHGKAASVVVRLLDEQAAALSVQVLKEFYTVATRKIPKTLSRKEAAVVIRDLCLTCRVMDDTLPQLHRALELVNAHGLSIWDASIVAAAEAVGCTGLYTEDLVHGSVIGTVQITNPLRP